MASEFALPEGFVTTKAIVISSLKYSEADLIVKCFTESHGLKSFLLRNILKSKKGKLRTSMFQALTQLEIVLKHREKKSLQSIREAKIVSHYKTLHTDVYKTSVVLFLSEILKNSIQVEETDQKLFNFLEKAFLFLDQAENFANFHIVFLLELTAHLGFYPDNSTENSSYFNLLEGTFQTEETGKYCLKKADSHLLKSLLNTDFAHSSQLKLNGSQRSHFLEILLQYYDLHLSGFRKPKSLEVLQQLFS